jgi:hypothetical protein
VGGSILVVALNLSKKLNYAVLHITEDLFLNEIRGVTYYPFLRPLSNGLHEKSR